MPERNYPQFAEICEKAARRGGEILLKMRGNVRASEKRPNDLVTDADFAAQSAIREIIAEAFPDHGFLGEEAPAPSRPGTTNSPHANQSPDHLLELPYCWIVDPLDGTVNYYHGLNHFCVSVALAEAGKVIVGAIFAPVLEEFFFAELGQPSTLNNSPLQPSGCRELHRSLVAVSLPTKSTRQSLEVKRLIRLVEATQSIRRLGSAALNLCYVGAGRLDGYLATSVNAWDIAAAALIAENAGAVVRHPNNHPWDLHNPQILAAASTPLWRQLLLQVTDV